MTTGDAKVGGAELLDQGGVCLKAGDSAQAFELLQQAASVGVPEDRLHELVTQFALAGRFTTRQHEVLQWIEKSLTATTDVASRATLLRAQVAVCRQLDLKRVQHLADAALEAAELAQDEEAYACILSHAAFAGYRRGDLQTAQQYAELAATRPFESLAARYDAVRAQMFSASARGDLESALHLAMRGRAMARELGRPADTANESANLAEAYLELGCPEEGFRCGQAAVELASACGHLSVELMGNVLCAIAIAESGQIDDALDRFDKLVVLDQNRILAVDRATVHAYWLLERGAAGDAKRARVIAQAAVASANKAGVGNRLMALHAIIARAWAREGREVEAIAALETGRRNGGRSESAAQLLLALAVAEVLPVKAPKRTVVLNNARTKILRGATHREDPHAFCTKVRLHRRLLELTGGVPEDLPRAD